jgi:putative holliday junction resolvase
MKRLGRLLAIDLGAKRVGVAVSDELWVTVRPLDQIERRSWKDLLQRVSSLIQSYEARALVIGLPLRLDGSEGPSAMASHELADKFRLSLSVPVYLHDERLTTFAAKTEMKSEGRSDQEMRRQIDSEAAAVILRDFIANASLNDLNQR